MELTRRSVLVGALAGGGLAIGYLLRQRTFPPPLSPGRDEVALDAWVKIGTDGVVTVAVPQLEMGQGISTLIPQVVCEEMGADWRRIAVEPAPPSGAYANVALAARWADLWLPSAPGFAGAAPVARRWAEDRQFNATADGLSLAAYEGPARAAAASARALLAMAAADRWGVDWEECKVEGGQVSHGDKRLGFGKLAARAATLDPPASPPLRPGPARERPVPASAPPRYPRLDLPAKAAGSLQFAGDVRLPDMVHAAIRHAPVGDATLSEFDPKEAAGVSGLVSFVTGKRWLAATAQTWWAAERALALVAPTFAVQDRVDSSRIEAALEKALLFGEAERIAEAGDPDEVLDRDFSLAVRYDVAPALHAGLETASATARFTDAGLEVWVAAQAPSVLRAALADAFGLPVAEVTVYPVAAGGSFDRRLEHEHAIEAAAIARATGRPVQLTWSRWQEAVAGLPRAPVAAALAARTAPDGSVVGWKARIATPPATREFGRRLFDGRSARGAMLGSAGEADAGALEGAVPAYVVAHLAVEHVPAEVGLPAGRMRGGAHGYTAFFNECFVDELARKAGREPLSFRIAMLGHDRRLVDCLQRVAALAGWDAGADASGQGLACHVISGRGPEARIAAIATARRDERGVRVDRIAAVADIGRVVNLDIARQQVEGGLVFGIGLALGASPAWIDGLPETGRLGAMGLPLLADCPEIVVDFVDSEADPADPGEIGVAVAAPALANALYSATGLRLRRLPLLSGDV